ncbi:plasma membrane fusion protein prm1 [Tilletia horrida]|uniref:Plasma membrane fusion protein PRM1 n=1 Tax=Tilletia horrida TaxID=155126 RepID=A0AAN6GZR7_9BASI|nr:plasma membrane fusion protein prm1 [Tilletia horrida]KAK0567338.1 plasma membrane fusion protein prm1 [Tilletia horrida]
MLPKVFDRPSSTRWKKAPLPARDPKHLLFRSVSSASTAHSTPPPFLSLRSRLLLAALSPTLLGLIAVLVTVAIPLLTAGASPIQTRIDQAKDRLTSACGGVQAAAAAIQGVPHYMATGTNRMIASTVVFFVQGLGHLLMLLLIATEQVLLYVVDTYRSLLQCLIELLIRGVLAVLTEAVQILSNGINEASQGIKAAVQAAVAGVNTVISTALSGVNDVLHIVGKSVSVPQIDVPNLSALDNVRLPTFFEDGLIALNNTIPTLDQVKDKINAVISAPLVSLRVDVNNSINAFSFNQSTLDVPALPTPAIQICNASTIADATGPLDELAHAVHKLELFLLIGLLFAMLLVALGTVGLEWWAWRSMWRHVKIIRDVCGRTDDTEPHTHPTQTPANDPEKAALTSRFKTDSESKWSALKKHASEEQDGDPERKRALEAYRNRTTQHPISSYWLNASDMPEPYAGRGRQPTTGAASGEHQQVHFAALPSRSASRATVGTPSLSSQSTTRLVVVSDHCMSVPDQQDSVNGLSSATPAADPLASDRGTLDLVHLVHHPLTTAFSLRVASFMRVRHGQTLDAIRWYLGGWIGHAGMLALFAFAIFGALSSEVHILALGRLANTYDKRLTGSLTDFTSGIQSELQAAFLTQSITYANQVNGQIQSHEDQINHDVFGWVNVTTSTMNNTLNEFVDMVDETVSDIFNNTILYSPVQNFINCILIRKVQGIETALTWIHDNAHVSFPRVDSDILTLNDTEMQTLLSPVTNLGSGVDNTGAQSSSAAQQPTVARIVAGQLKALRRQRDFFLGLLAVWVLLAVVGLLMMFRRMRGHRSTRQRRGEHDGQDLYNIPLGSPSRHVPWISRARRQVVGLLGQKSKPWS